MYDIYARVHPCGIVYGFTTSFYVLEGAKDCVLIGQSEDKDAHKQYEPIDENGLFNYEIIEGVLHERDKTAELKRLEDERLSSEYIPSWEESSLYAFQKILGSTELEDSEKIGVSAFYPNWALGKYEVGDVRNHAGQTWECWTAHDNAIYPDITPDNPQTWANFWRPLHGKTPDTARPWIKPWAGTTDMYHAGEYMVYIDGKTYECVSDTVYSPDEYAQAWSVIGEESEPEGGYGEESQGPSDEYPEWVQPTGAHDAYAQGAKVNHNGKKWMSDGANNVWEPGIYGWTEVVERQEA